ncbi:ABC transporter ATP-binding protein [Dolosicoccus paucivorans]|uniref:ABC transporter ATP-binding protein n=1 Tax=Dolosicoccus paucivorans TaxID=84521 RepID=A0A1G8J5Y4_9LACT|nr:ABC transporter ATP-binding protein [Dolosicoccus paucivorans]PMC59099.1 ABC transporter ATP-binding protein [Dolosicoccus paucivorans]SDI26659.1 ATP-binding cassette, subfamily B [Dolosicoccus paucivorans]
MLRDFFSYYKPYKKLFILDFGSAFLLGVLELFFPIAVRSVIDNVLPTKNFRLIAWITIGLIALYLLSTALNYIVVRFGHTLGVNIETDIRRELFEHFQTHSFEYYDEKKTGELMSRLTSDLFEVSEFAHHGPEDMFITVMTIVAAFFLMLRVNVTLAVGTVLIVPLLALIMAYFNRRMIQINRQVYKNLGHFNAELMNSLAGIRVVKAFSNEEYEKERFESLIQQYRRDKIKFYTTIGTSSSVNYLMVRIINIYTFFVGSYFTITDQMTIGELAGFIVLANVLIRPIEKMNVMIEQYPRGWAGFRRFKEELARQPKIVDAPDAVEATGLKGDIEYKDVSFSYDSEHPVLEKINLSIRAGETIAFVGPSGAGKTTLVNLLPRFYEIDEGEITIDGINIQSFTQQSLRSQIGIVQQDVFLFAGTLRDNIAYGKLDATEEEIWQAVKAARLEEVVRQMPDGLDTEIGERGVRLSGGQQQRLSIARIFLKNPSILILDEATSALDSETEMQIQQSFDELATGRTTLIIAHRLATIQHADRIVVVTEEGIKETGSHEELLELDGHYAKLYYSQFRQATIA